MRPETDLRADLAARLSILLSTSTEVPEGEHEVLPGDARIVAAVDDTILPMIEALAPATIRRHPDGEVVARFGPAGDDGLLIQTYVVSQHGHARGDEDAGILLDGNLFGFSGSVMKGRGAAQHKGAMAAVLTALEMLPASLRRPVTLAVNTEGMSSHGGSRRVIDDLGVRAAWGILATGTDLRVSLGNRGRVDLYVGIDGGSTHSSRPVPGGNPLTIAGQVLSALDGMPLPAPHPRLGPAALTPYQLFFDPIAPHTIPASGRLIVDRRLLPGERPESVTAEFAAELRARVGAPLRIEEGPSMLPAEVDSSARHVQALLAGLADQGVTAETFYSTNTFDAGYGCDRGIPTVMFGPGRRDFGVGVTAPEVVALDDCWTAAVVFARLIDDLCG